MDLADDSRRSLKASLLPPQSFTSLQDQLAEMPSSDYEMKPEDFQSLQHLDGNKECIDCGAANPDWGSPHLGILFCAQCSGHHRGLGTHISFVRSVTMDQWTDSQLAHMRVGGNSQCRAFLEEHGIVDFATCNIQQRYDSKAAALYKQVLSARMQGLPEPTELVVSPSNEQRPLLPLKDRIQGLGSSPLPSPGTPTDWKKVALQLTTVSSILVGAGLFVVYYLK